jgi:hypothetical protein
MRDAEHEYPLHQSHLHEDNGHHGVIDDQTEDDGLEAERFPRPGAGSLHQREVATTPDLPRGRVKNALIIGVIAGVLSIAQSIIITLVNAPTYHAYDVTKDIAVKNALAFTIFGYAVLTFFITLLICLIAGFIVGKICVHRRLAFLAGFVAGIIIDATSFITRYIPQYPGNQQVSGGSIDSAGVAAGSILIILAFLLVWGIIAGLVSLLGGWLATRKHPFYVGY